MSFRLLLSPTPVRYQCSVHSPSVVCVSMCGVFSTCATWFLVPLSAKLQEEWPERWHPEIYNYRDAQRRGPPKVLRKSHPHNPFVRYFPRDDLNHLKKREDANNNMIREV